MLFIKVHFWAPYSFLFISTHLMANHYTGLLPSQHAKTGYIYSPTHSVRSIFDYSHPNVSSSSTLYLTLQQSLVLAHDSQKLNLLQISALTRQWDRSFCTFLLSFWGFLLCQFMHSFFILDRHCVLWPLQMQKQMQNYKGGLKWSLGENKFDMTNKLTSMILLLVFPPTTIWWIVANNC